MKSMKELRKTLRVKFSDDVEPDLINDDLAARIATLLTFNNGKNLESGDSAIKKRVTAEIFTADRQVRLSQGRDFYLLRSHKCWSRINNRFKVCRLFNGSRH